MIIGTIAFSHNMMKAVLAESPALIASDPLAALDEMTRVLRKRGRIALMTSVRRQLTLRPLKPLIERASGMRVFEPDEIVVALQERGYNGVRQRLAGMVQFVGGRYEP